jgi:hypothetical protein
MEINVNVLFRGLEKRCDGVCVGRAQTGSPFPEGRRRIERERRPSWLRQRVREVVEHAL